LANVSSLMDEDVPRAKLMLETFTDYLRASLGSLRRLDATLGAEMDLVGHYLELMKTRMEERMQYKVLCDPNLRNVVLPPFLLQPLVENALHHGLEPKVEGGSIQVSARQEGAELVLEVIDDGLGPDVTRRRPGAGMALANVRERLQVQFGGAATLTLNPAEPGMRATIRMPYLAGA
jgi:sensor histidine kinase YesM